MEHSVFRIRRISTKLLLAVVAAVVIPFVGFAIFVDTQMAQRLSKQVVLQSLKGLAVDLADRVDRDLEEWSRDLELWSHDEVARQALDEVGLELKLAPEEPMSVERITRARDEGLLPSDTENWNDRWTAIRYLDDRVRLKQAYDLVLMVDATGKLAAMNAFWPDGAAVDASVLAELYARDYSGYDWFGECMAGRWVNVGRKVTDLVPLANEESGVHPENYHLGFGSPILQPDSGEAVGVLYALVNWKHVQERVRESILVQVFQGFVGPELQPSAYAWIWDNDADTIIAHPKTDLYDEKVSGPVVDLPQLVEAARREPGGLYPEYEFLNVRKNAAFQRTQQTDDFGFGWVVGVGIDNDDIFMAVDEVRSLLLKATLFVVLVAILWTMVIARRATIPILALKAHTQRVAGGDLDARIEVSTDDELGELGSAFNQMTSDLKANREQLVRIEKDAAWREMARQVAHDIKNPLTPIQLWADLLKRAKDEDSPEFDRIFEQTIETISRQVRQLREIASDFHALTGAAEKKPETFRLKELVDEVFALNAAWAAELGVAVEQVASDDPGNGDVHVHVDRGLLRRVLINVVSNAFQAMPDGGVLTLRQLLSDGFVTLELCDTGTGIPDDVRAHLFEPYFTTKSHGTGLGLAIARRVIDEMGGAIGLVPHVPDGETEPAGTVCRIVLPLAARDSAPTAVEEDAGD